MYGWYWCDTLGRLSESSISNALKLLHWFCLVTACGWDSLLVAPSSLFASSYFYCFCTATTSSFWLFSRIQPFSFPYYPFCHSERVRVKEKEGEESQRERETVIRLGENSQSPSQRTIRLFSTSPICKLIVIHLVDRKSFPWCQWAMAGLCLRLQSLGGQHQFCRPPLAFPWAVGLHCRPQTDECS